MSLPFRTEMHSQVVVPVKSNLNDQSDLFAPIFRWLEILGHLEAGGVIEVCGMSGGSVRHVGYFDNYEGAAKAILQLDENGRESIFINLNPANRDLLGRANNRLRENSFRDKVERTKDHEIHADGWLLIDADPRRASGISSTDTELASGIQVGMDVVNWLIEIGVPQHSILTAFSGNGIYVLVKTLSFEPTNVQKDRKSNVLKYIAALFNTAEVEIDQSVFNQSRLIGALGTVKRKGDSTVDRPHRRSSISRVAGLEFDPHIEQTVESVDIYALIEGLIPPKLETATYANSKSKQSDNAFTGGGFDIRDYAHLLEDKKESARGYSYYTCPSCKGYQKLHVNENTGAYGCFHRKPGTCDFTLLRKALRHIAGKEVQGISEIQNIRKRHNEDPLDNSLNSLNSLNSPYSQAVTHIQQWPSPLKEAAYHGLAGELVRLIEPHSEADPVAILIQFLVLFGNVIGRNAYFRVEADLHYLNLFVVVVGTTSKGRKGTSLGQAKRIIGSADADWLAKRFNSGLSSGEGLIHAVRDPIEKEEPEKEDIKQGVKGFGTTTPKMRVVDPGVEDKRLVVVESEFASVLKVVSREGNTLSAIIRQAWDDGDLSSMTKNSPTRATDAHISIIGHITKDELQRCLDKTETANGFANRIIWVASRRSKLLPEGGNLQDIDFKEVERRLKTAINFARESRNIKRDEEARQLWINVYPELSEGKPGMLGAITSRSEAQVMRLACLYALLDCSSVIQLKHLEAALEIWRYSEDSVRFIFGHNLGDPVADQILSALIESGEAGMTRTQISGLFSRHTSRPDINRALTMLSQNDRIASRKIATEGRSVELWFAIPLNAKQANDAKKEVSVENSQACEKSEKSEKSNESLLSSREANHISHNSSPQILDEEEF